MNMKRLAMAVVAVFVFIFATDWLVHGTLLGKAYEETASLWRPKSEMQNTFCWLLLGQFLYSFGLVVVFVKGYEGKGIMEGARFGVFMLPFALAPLFIQYAVTPLTCHIWCTWLIACSIQVVASGCIAAAIYRR